MLLSATNTTSFLTLRVSVAPKFNNNASRVWGARVQLVNAGQTAAQNNKADEVLKILGYVPRYNNEPLFASVDQKQEDNEGVYT